MVENSHIHIQYWFEIIITSGFATTHVVDFLWVCKTSYHLLISPPPTNLPNSLPSPYHSTCHAPQQQRVTLERNKIDRQSRMWRQYTCYFPANRSTNPDEFQPKTFLIPRGIIPQNSMSLGFVITEEIGNILQTDHSLTDKRFYRVIIYIYVAYLLRNVFLLGEVFWLLKFGSLCIKMLGWLYRRDIQRRDKSQVQILAISAS